jgi:hypothetical protein
MIGGSSRRMVIPKQLRYAKTALRTGLMNAVR